MLGLILDLLSLRSGTPGEEQVPGGRSRVVVDILGVRCLQNTQVRCCGGSSGKAPRNLGSRYRSAQG